MHAQVSNVHCGELEEEENGWYDESCVDGAGVHDNGCTPTRSNDDDHAETVQPKENVFVVRRNLDDFLDSFYSMYPDIDETTVIIMAPSATSPSASSPPSPSASAAPSPAASPAPLRRENSDGG